VPLLNVAGAYSPFISSLPSEDTLQQQVGGVEQVVRVGLDANQAAIQGRGYGRLVSSFGLPEESFDAVLNIFDTFGVDSVEWLTSAVAPVTESFGVIGAVIKFISSLVSNVVRSIREVYDTKSGRPIGTVMLRYSRAADEDLTRVLLSMSGTTDLQLALEPPNFEFADYPSRDDPTKPSGARVTVTETKLWPGGRPYLGISVPPAKSKNSWGQVNPTPVTALYPSASPATAVVWSTLLGDSAAAWSVDTDKLITQWVEAADRYAALMFGIQPFIGYDQFTVNPFRRLQWLYDGKADGPLQPWIPASSLPKSAREEYLGRRALVPVTYVPSPGTVPPPVAKTAGTGWAIAETTKLSGYRGELDSWLPPHLAAIAGLFELRKRQRALAKTVTAAWASPEQPGAAQWRTEIEMTRKELLPLARQVDQSRILDPAYRSLIKQRSLIVSGVTGKIPRAKSVGRITGLTPPSQPKRAGLGLLALAGLAALAYR